ncbi:MAG: DUF1648 domain-containing protein [Armatimonadetes bacterium]|nr:DUF1648 domain-containing protein [Armatimonadota bacterium]
MLKSERPIIQFTPTTTEVILDRVSLVGLLLTVAYLTGCWASLPERIPTHFGVSGTPDGWGSRYMLLLFVAIPIVIHVAFGYLVRVPHIYNYPTKVTPENAERLYSLGRGLMYWLRAEMVLLFALLCWGTVRVALEQAEGLGPWPIWVALPVIYGTVIYFVVAMFRARGPRPT